MKIIIPMSGVGKRFSDAGYKDPKPLIDVDGTPMIYHVIDLFPDETDFHFICNEIHTNIDTILLKKIPNATITFVPNEGRKGPVHAVSYIFDTIDDNEEVIVSYCDYGTVWDYKKFLEGMRINKCDGGIASYIGFSEFCAAHGVDFRPLARLMRNGLLNFHLLVGNPLREEFNQWDRYGQRAIIFNSLQERPVNVTELSVDMRTFCGRAQQYLTTLSQMK
jgi:hypothetical protein